LYYPEDFEHKIGFRRIREMLAHRCKGTTAKELCGTGLVLADIDEIKRKLAATDEMKTILLLHSELSITEYPDISHLLKQLCVDGIILAQEEFVDLFNVLSQSKNVLNYFKKANKDTCRNLYSFVEGVVFPQFVYDRIDFVFSRDGRIKDKASKTLFEVRSSLISNKKLISSKLNNLLETFHKEGWLSSDLSATIVNGRTVLPIETTHKRKIQGLIHDESASGKTSYIEPAEVVGMNNRQRELELEEQREIRRILKELTADIIPYKSDISGLFGMLVILDFIRAKAILAIEMDAIRPEVHDDMNIELHEAKNPLLLMAFKNENRRVIPLNLSLNEKQRIMLISGPNAGGKSVAMKTVALLQYMTQCGMLIPCGGNTSMGMAKKMFIEMGDEQSIENDLSTYSSHLLNMKFFLKNACERTLIFIDELGSGTEPVQGGAIAEAILKQLLEKKCCGIVTTHYTNLKAFASATEGIENGAMLIDNNLMKPTFQFQAGLPGNSYALEIADRIGLPQAIIIDAKEKAGTGLTKLESLMRKTLRDRRYYERKRLVVRQQEKQLEQKMHEYEEKIRKLNAERKKILEESKIKAGQILKDMNSQIESTIRIIREINADKEKTRKLRQELESYVAEKNDEFLKIDSDSPVEEEFKQYANKELEFVDIDPEEIHIGSKVRLAGHETIGEVVDMGSENAVVQFDSVITSVAKSKLEKVPDNETSPKTRISAGSLYQNINELRSTFKPSIDVRGKRAEEALSEITVFVDTAIVLGVSQLKILHGKGNGVLRKAIREQLKSVKEVAYFSDEDIRFGGDGITVVQMK